MGKRTESVEKRKKIKLIKESVRKTGIIRVFLRPGLSYVFCDEAKAAFESLGTIGRQI